MPDSGRQAAPVAISHVLAAGLLPLFLFFSGNTHATKPHQSLAVVPKTVIAFTGAGETESVSDVPGRLISNTPKSLSALECKVGTDTGQRRVPIPVAHGPGQSGGKKIATAIASDCLVSIGAVLAPWRRGDRTLVDVRKTTEYERYRIPGAINIPKFAVRTKAFLKPRHIVLLNEGRSYDGLLHTCRRLKQEGFKRVSILDGGMLTWVRHSAPLSGVKPSRKQLDAISPQEFATARLERDWIVVHEIQDKKEPAVSLHELPVIRYQGDQQALRTAITRLLQKGKPINSTGILLVGARNAISPAIDRVLHEIPLKYAFYLDGGVDAYKDYQLRQQQLLAAQSAQRTMKPQRCGS